MCKALRHDGVVVFARAQICGSQGPIICYAVASVSRYLVFRNDAVGFPYFTVFFFLTVHCVKTVNPT